MAVDDRQPADLMLSHGSDGFFDEIVCDSAVPTGGAGTASRLLRVRLPVVLEFAGGDVLSGAPVGPRRYSPQGR